SLLKLRLWLYGPGLPEPKDRQRVMSKAEASIREIVMNMNRSLLLEDCYAMSPHCMSDLIVAPDAKQAIRYIAIKAGIVLLTVAATEVARGKKEKQDKVDKGDKDKDRLTKPRGKTGSCVRCVPHPSPPLLEEDLMLASTMHEKKAVLLPKH
ncbi:hypothetical protein DIPPA_13313, partial [Diplonema papillatum]